MSRFATADFKSF